MASRRLRWTLRILAAVLALLAIVVVVWSAKRGDHLRETLARQEAEGLDTTFAALLRDAPEVSVPKHWRLVDWCQRHALRSDSWSDTQIEETLLVGKDLPAKPLADHEAFRAAATELAEYLEDETARFDCLATAQATLDGRDPAPDWVPPLLFPGQLVLGKAARWYAVEAVRGDDPGWALRALDRLVAASARPSCQIEHQFLASRGMLRDRGYLRLALLGTAAPARLAGWLEEPPPSHVALADVLRADRLYVTAPRAHAHLAGTLDAQDASYRRGNDDLLDALERLYHGGVEREGEMVLHLELPVGFERILRGERPVSHLDELAKRQGSGFLGLGVQFFLSTVWGDRHVHAHHRSARLCARALEIRRETGAFPADEAAFRLALGEHAAALDGGPWAFRLRYELLEPQRIRIEIDPTARWPEVLRSYSGSLTPMRGSTPPKAPFILDQGTGFVVDVGR